jgi:hypothetical protein
VADTQSRFVDNLNQRTNAILNSLQLAFKLDRDRDGNGLTLCNRIKIGMDKRQ